MLSYGHLKFFTLGPDIGHRTSNTQVILYSVQCCYALHWTDNDSVTREIVNTRTRLLSNRFWQEKTIQNVEIICLYHVIEQRTILLSHSVLETLELTAHVTCKCDFMVHLTQIQPQNSNRSKNHVQTSKCKLTTARHSQNFNLNFKLN